jgi:Zn-dependent metalloprotease
MKRILVQAALVLALLTADERAIAQKAPYRPLQGRPSMGILDAGDGLDGLARESVQHLMRRLQAFALGDAAPSRPSVPLPSPGPGVRRSLRQTVSPAFRVDLPLIRIERADNGTVRWMRGRLSTERHAAKTAPSLQFVDWARGDLERYARVLRLEDPSNELTLRSVDRDDLGYVHVRFKQVHEGLPVWSRDLVAHYDATGALYAVNGSYEPSPQGIDASPLFGAEIALQTARQNLVNEGRWAPLSKETAAFLDLVEPQPRLVLYPSEERGVRLAYEVIVHPNLIERYRYLIDAKSGEVLNRIAEHCSLDPFGDTPLVGGADLEFHLRHGHPSTTAGTFVNGQGGDLNGQTQTFRVHRDDGGTHWLFADLDNIGSFQLPNLPENGGAVTVSANNQDLKQDTQVSYVTSADNSWNDPSAISAHANMQVTYDYFKSIFGRQAINNENQSLVSIVRVSDGGRGLDNAYWNSRHMIYGEGDQVFKPLAGGLDVATHEMTHGVIQHTAGLVYQAQSGALNESFADVFGVMVDKEDFLVGEDVMKDGHDALRDLLNPDNPRVRSGNPAINGDYTQPAHMNDYKSLPNTAEGDNGGVHINSGIPNRAAALIIQAIGHDKAQRIYYRALSNYLTRNSQFGDARNAVVQSAVDLYGDGAEATAARQAFDAVGIGEGTQKNDPKSNDIPAVTGSRSIIAFVVADGSALSIPNGSIAFIDPYADGFLGVFTDPNARARLGSQLTTTVDGSSVWFIDQQGRLAIIDLSQVNLQSATSFAEAPVVVAQDFFLEQPGDIANVSVGPIGITPQGEIIELVALASAYDDDPYIYFTDLEEVVPIELAPETTQQGITNDLIRYPDVMAWSPNPNEPQLAFDALQGVPLSSGLASDYWSIYEIDFSVEQIYELIPTQPAHIDVGNVTYARTNPDIVAFNVIEDGLWDIYLADFETGQLAALELPSLVDEGQNPILTDAERPTFAPDDAFVAFASSARQSLIFYRTSDGNLDEIPFDVVPFAPHWFIARGDVSDIVKTGNQAEELPEGSVHLEGAFPNPFVGQTTVRLTLGRHETVRVVVHDALGRIVRSLVDQSLAPGVHDLKLDGAELPAGTYFLRLEAGNTISTRSLVKIN